jgi:aminoacrylate peracid reductase
MTFPTSKENNMTWIPIIPPGSAPPLAPYVPATRADNVVYVSGTLAMDASGKVVGEGDARAQTRAVIESIRTVLQSSGADLENIAYNMIFISSREHYAAMNEIYGEYFGRKPPARYCLIADLVKPEFLVEITSVAHLPAAA